MTNSKENRKYYETKFAGYDDLVTPADISKMLDGVNISTVRGMLWRSEIKSFRIGNRYLAPKSSVIDYVLSDAYQELKDRKRAYIQTKIVEEDVIGYRLRLLAFCSKPRSRKEMMLFLNLSSPKIFYRLILNPLLETGELHRTIKSRDCISTQKYIRGAIAIK